MQAAPNGFGFCSYETDSLQAYAECRGKKQIPDVHPLFHSIFVLFRSLSLWRENKIQISGFFISNCQMSNG